MAIIDSGLMTTLCFGSNSPTVSISDISSSSSRSSMFSIFTLFFFFWNTVHFGLLFVDFVWLSYLFHCSFFLLLLFSFRNSSISLFSCLMSFFIESVFSLILIYIVVSMFLLISVIISSTMVLMKAFVSAFVIISSLFVIRPVILSLINFISPVISSTCEFRRTSSPHLNSQHHLVSSYLQSELYGLRLPQL